MNDSNYDIAIIGGGPVGTALALALRNSKLRICLLEVRPAGASTDTRALAVSYGSRLLLERLGVWNKMQEVSSISTIHISQKQSFGRAILRSTELAVPDLGYVLPYSTLQDSLTDAVHVFTRLHDDRIRTIHNASVTELAPEADHTRISYQLIGEQHTLLARLAVVADGGRLLNAQFPPAIHDYGQSALITHITCSLPKVSTAFERFTPQGPVALLPYKEGYEIVWTAPHKHIDDMLTWDDAHFLSELQQHFGDRVGKFLTAGKRSSFPLGLKRAPDQSPMPHTVLLGNAAQTMHPVAGQGFNLGLRDAWELAQTILDAAPESLGSAAMLLDYKGRRRLDREAGIRFTDTLVRLFSNDLAVLDTARGISLTALDCLPFAKKFVAKRMMFGANG